MKAKSNSEKSNEELKSIKKAIIAISSILGGLIVVSLSAAGYFYFQGKTFLPLVISSVCLIPILLINLNNISGISKELKSRQ
jgi:hypothetical protein